MRHRKKGRQLGRQTKHRWALFRSLVTSLLEHERIETTEAKAKEIRGFTDRMITLGKDGSLPARRRAWDGMAYARRAPQPQPRRPPGTRPADLAAEVEVRAQDGDEGIPAARSLASPWG